MTWVILTGRQGDLGDEERGRKPGVGCDAK